MNAAASFSAALGLMTGESVLVLGLGDSGLAMARWCAREGAEVAVWDSRESAPQDGLLATEWPQITRQRGEPVLPAACTRVLKSPGLAPHDPRIAAVLAAARAQGLAVQAELDLFAQALAFLKREWRYDPAVLAITGTNGKTTTTTLTGQLCEAAGRRVAVAGNIGPTLLDTLRVALVAEGPRPQAELPLEPLPPEEPARAPEAAGDEAADAMDDGTSDGTSEAKNGNTDEASGTEACVAARADAALEDLLTAEADGVSLEQLDELLETQALPIDPPPPRAPQFAALPQVWVLELSSFQLDAVEGFEPTAATVLNVTQDHLDWHGDLAAYAAAKARVFGQQGLMVINHDDPLVEAMVPQPPAPPLGARGKPLKAVPKWQPRRVCRFGLEAPTRPGDFGLETQAGMAWLVRALPQDDTPLKKRQRGADDDLLQVQRLMPADALRLRGRHNTANALAALALATAAGCLLAPLLHRLREYRGEPHRTEWLGTLAGVDFIDDSKGTNVGATVAAIAGLGADREHSRLAVILGGDGKGQDFTPLLAPLQRHARAVALVGRHPETAAQLDALLKDTPFPVQRHDTLEAATAWAFAQCEGGDSVVLSPACASLDMFRNYAHRAEVFTAAMHDLAAAQGEMSA